MEAEVQFLRISVGPCGCKVEVADIKSLGKKLIILKKPGNKTVGREEAAHQTKSLTRKRGRATRERRS